MLKKCFGSLALLVAGSLMLAPAFAQNGQWSAAMGQSGLRRFYSTGSDLGELVNRQLSYRLAKQTSEAASDVDGYVLQWDSLVPVGVARDRPVFLRGLVRFAKRIEPGKVHGRNDRFDLGVLYALTSRSYVGLGLAYEHTHADIKFVEGTTTGNAVGPRFDGGVVLTNTLALGVRMEELRFDGRSTVSVQTPGGTLNIDREIESKRRFLKTEVLSRYTRAQLEVLPAGMQLGWMGGIHYLETRYEPKIDSRGQPVIEPFGSRERLGLARAGGFVSATLGSNWNASLELMFDYEFDTNLNDPIDDKATRYLRAGLGYALARGKRIQFDYQGFRSHHGIRERNNFTLIAVIDF